MQKMCMYFVMCMYFAAFTIICVVISALSVSSAMGKFRKEGLTKHSLRPILDWRKCIVLGKFRQYIFPFTDRTRTCYEIRQKQENIVRSSKGLTRKSKITCVWPCMFRTPRKGPKKSVDKTFLVFASLWTFCMVFDTS